MKWIITILKVAIKAGYAAQSALEKFDANVVGWDDDAARKIGDALDTLQTIVAANPVEIEARGYDEIAAFGARVLAGLDALKASGVPTAATIAEARALAASLADPAKVFQAKRGADAGLLADLKASAVSKVAEIEAAV